MHLASLFEMDVHPNIVDLAKYCAEISGDRVLPRRKQFRPTRVARVISYLFLIDVLAEEDDYRFSLFGSNMTLLYGADLTGMRLSEFGNDTLRSELRSTYDHVVANGKPLYVRGRYEWPEMSVAIERLLVPMTDETGKVTTVLGVAIPDTEDNAILLQAGLGPARLVVEDILALQ